MPNAPEKYPVGRLVQVIPGRRNNTPRRGIVRMLIWHAKDRCYDYYIRVCDKGLSKRYREEDLVPDIISPSWLTSTTVAIAEGIYADRAFDRLPILADALQDAGCEDADLLGHCRSAGPHVRGCWVVDLVLGKS